MNISSIAFGPFQIPVKVILLAAALMTAQLILWTTKDREQRKSLSDIYFNSILLYILGWRLSLILTNWSSFRNSPGALLYLPGSMVNHLAGFAVILAVTLISLRRGRSRPKELLHGAALLSGSVLLYLLLNLLLTALPAADQPGKTGESNPQQLREISLLNLEGEEEFLNIDEAAIVNFWASWCPPCRAEIPEIRRYYKENSEGPVRLITINLSSTESSGEDVLDFIREEGIDFPVLLDHKGEAAAYFGINSVPTTLLFNSRGELTGRHSGVVDVPWLRSQGRRLLSH